jgi:hypothetical protein
VVKLENTTVSETVSCGFESHLGYISERIKIKLSNLGLVKKDKQLYERKLCSFFAKPPKQIGRVYFSSTTKSFYTTNAIVQWKDTTLRRLR